MELCVHNSIPRGSGSCRTISISGRFTWGHISSRRGEREEERETVKGEKERSILFVSKSCSGVQ